MTTLSRKLFPCLPWLWVPKLSFASPGGYPCCCGEKCSRTCSACLDNIASQSWTVVVSGLANDRCANCADLDGTYICEWYESPPAPYACLWTCAIDPTVCGCTVVAFQVYNPAGTTYIEVRAEPHLGSYAPNKTQGFAFLKPIYEELDCCVHDPITGSSEPLWWSGQCNNVGGATCTVTPNND